ncbi:WXG100 family type VII secretion target [Glycomyces sp. L485]|uniref:WXG100 family type VII secretion target n=1 Tax=Glycomyces sp. L485 TaxID=2909235 RepID=UPI001F4B15A0|nr:WXG100 family type VII secretion target [Glycomyces sp. L485]MCH7231099.1 WXG100 family type VII secretion target [Glycomyces sp. L485]
MPGFDIDPESMRQAADNLDASAEEVQGLLDQFTGALEQFADAFGGDEIGMLVGIAHQACTDGLTECFSTNIEELSDYAQSLREMADNHQTVDDETTAIFNSLLDELGG